MRIRLSGNEHGDTIVEVLIAVAIVSFVLAVAYATSNHNVKSTVDAQEHSQAIKAVQAQLEFLRNQGKTAANDVCFDTSNGTELASSNAACTVSPYGASTQPNYKLQIFQPIGGSNSYTVTATWPSVFGNGLDSTITMYYRPPPG